jgi:chromosome segregation ATPase
MSEEERQYPDDTESPDIESETTRLMEEAMSKGVHSESTDPPDEQKTAVQINVTFQRLQGRILDLLGSIEDTLKAIEPEISERVTAISDAVAKRLSGAGLGVFATSAIKHANQEIQQGFAVEDLLNPVYESLEESRASVQDIMTKAGRGAVRNVGTSASGLQARLVQMYANLNEMDKRLESARAEVRKWRGKANELEERLRQREEVMGTSSEELTTLQQQIASLGTDLEERDNTISSLKGELGQVQSQLEQQAQLISNMDSVEKVAADFDSKVIELSEVKGQLAQTQERFAQKETENETLKDEIANLKEKISEFEDVLAGSADEMASLRGAKQVYDSEIGDLKTQIIELKTRWDSLYQIAEDTPEFKAYFLIADKTQWFQLSHLSSALGIPTVLLKRQMQKFIDAGLIEMENDQVRARSLSDLAKEAEGKEAKMLEEAKAEVGDEEIDPDKPFDPKDLVMPTPEYTGPEEGDYEQEGR